MHHLAAAVIAKAQWLPAVAGLSSILLLSILAVSLQIHDHPKISPLDELVHGDYLVKAAHGELPRRGSLVGQEMLREDACRRADLPNFEAPACSSAILKPELFQGSGYNYEAGGQPPVYYYATGLVARLLVKMSVTPSLLGAGRALGLGWLAAGISVLWFALGELGIRAAIRVITTAPILVTPVVLDAHAFVTNDATALLIGAALMLSVFRWERSRCPRWVVLAVAALAAATKLTNLLGVGAMVLYLLARLATRGSGRAPKQPSGPRSAGETAVLCIAMLGTGCLVTLTWARVAAATALPHPPPNPLKAMFYVSHLGVGHVIAQVGDVLSPVGNPVVVLNPLAGHETFIALTFLLNLLLSAGCLTALATSPTGNRSGPLALAALLVMGAAGPAILVYTYATTHTAFLVPGRYGLTLLPMLVATFAASLAKRSMRYAAAGFSAVIVVTTLARLVSG